MPADSPQSAALSLPDQIETLIHDWQAHLALQVDSGEISPATRGAYARG